MKNLQKRQEAYPVTQDLSFVRDIVESEPKREFSFLSNIFSRRTVHNFINIRVNHYRGCIFHINKKED